MYDPGAFNVEFDFLTTVGANPVGYSSLKIEGVSYDVLNTAPNYGFVAGSPSYSITIQGGFKSPQGSILPNWTQPAAGTILQGTVFQSWANRIGTEISLEFTIAAGTQIYSNNNPANITFQWIPQGQSGANTLQEAITQALTTAYPTIPESNIVFSISGNYSPPGNTAKTLNHNTFEQFAATIASMTSSVSSNGSGVQITTTNTGFSVFDGSVGPNASNTITLLYENIIGQPTWIGPKLITFMTVMRADINVSTYVKFPPNYQNVPGYTTSTAQQFPSSVRQSLTFDNQTFLVTAVRQVGNFRDPQGSSWATIFQAVPYGA